MEKKLMRTDYNKMIFGVCNGIAEYFSVDVTLVRLLFVLSGIVYGGGIGIYIVLMIIMPVKYS